MGPRRSRCHPRLIIYCIHMPHPKMHTKTHAACIHTHTHMPVRRRQTIRSVGPGVNACCLRKTCSPSGSHTMRSGRACCNDEIWVPSDVAGCAPVMDVMAPVAIGMPLAGCKRSFNTWRRSRRKCRPSSGSKKCCFHIIYTFDGPVERASKIQWKRSNIWIN